MRITSSVVVLMATVFSTFVHGRSLCIAHRGNQTRALENSMEAFKAAVENGTDGVEYDIVHTKEGVALVHHDKELGRTTMNAGNGQCPNEKIKRLTFEEIKKNCVLKNGEPIPTLAEVVDYLKENDVYQFIEFKDHPSSMTIQYLAEALRDNEEKTRFISFESNFLDSVTNGIQNILQAERPLKALQLYRLFETPKNDHGVDVALTFRTIKKVSRQKDRETAIFTTDSVRKFKKAAKAKISFITTNDPELCLQTVTGIISSLLRKWIADKTCIGNSGSFDSPQIHCN